MQAALPLARDVPPNAQMFARTRSARLKEGAMLRLALIFLVVALVAALFGFGLVANLSYSAAKILFFIFLVLAVLSFIGGMTRRPID
jgi:uncharacterized membrane protein YtjA (UPF0391 family)